MLDQEDILYEFEYLLRKRLNDKSLPRHGDLIKCREDYFEVSWEGKEVVDLYSALVDEKKISNMVLEDQKLLTEYLSKILDNFTQNLKIIDCKLYIDNDRCLKDLSDWEYVKKIPKGYR